MSQTKSFSALFDPIPDPENTNLIKRLLEQKGVKPDSYKEKYFLRRIRVRMSRLGLRTYKEYYDVLRTNPEELKQFIESMSINVTRFFRNRDTFEFLENVVFPTYLKQKFTSNSNNNVTIWVAGVSLGAEAYTYSIIFSRLRERMRKNFTYSILATDINPLNINYANRGVYSPELLQELKKDEIEKYFTPTIDGEYRIKPTYQRFVRFERQDLLLSQYPKNVDIISCRNVLIYISKEEQERIINGFIRSLVPNGILILGRTESIFGEARKYLEPIDLRHRIYRKKSLSEKKTAQQIYGANRYITTKPTNIKKQDSSPTIVETGATIKEIIEKLRQANQESRKRYQQRNFYPNYRRHSSTKK